MIKVHSEKISNKFYKYIINILGVLVIALLAWYLYQNRDVFSALRHISWQTVLIIILIDTLTFLIISLMNYAMIKKLDPRVGFPECLYLQYANNFLNKFLPTIGGGAAFRAIYLKKKYQFPYSHFLSTVAGIYFINFFTTPFVGLVCLLLIYLQTGVYNWVVILAFIGLFLPSLTIIIIPIKIPESKNRLLKSLKNIIEGWNSLKKDPKYLLIYWLLSVSLLLLTALIKIIIYKSLTGSMNFISALFLSTIGIIITLLNFTPGGIGIQEGIYIFSADLVQIPDDILVLGSLVLHGITIIKAAILGGISYLVLMRQLNSLEDK